MGKRNQTVSVTVRMTIAEYKRIRSLAADLAGATGYAKKINDSQCVRVCINNQYRILVLRKSRDSAAKHAEDERCEGIGQDAGF